MQIPGLTALFLSALLLASPAFAARCEETRIRKEWRNLSRQEQMDYINAVKHTMQPRNGLPSRYDLLSKMHGDNAGPLHVHPIFMPWHRAFIFWFENALREYKSTVTLTYWDWAHDAQEPQAAPIWGKEPHHFGVNGDPNNDNCVTTGAFAGWKPKYPEEHCLKRVWRHQTRSQDKAEVANTISAFVNSATMNSLLTSSKTFGEVAKAIELTPHGTVHNNIGGDMLSMYSPNEPLFYLHHTNIDRLWDAWQKISSKNVNAYGGKNHNKKKATLKDSFLHHATLGGKKVKLGGPMTVGDVMDNSNFKGHDGKKKRTYCIIYQPRRDKPLPPRPTGPAPPLPRPVRPPPRNDEEEEEEEEPPRRPPHRPPPHRPPPRPWQRPSNDYEDEEEEEEERPRPAWGGGWHRPAPRRYVRPTDDEDEDDYEDAPTNRWGQRVRPIAMEEERLVRLLRRQIEALDEEIKKTDANADHSPAPFSEAWMKMNGIDKSEFYKQQIIVKETVLDLAKAYAKCGYIPPDSEIGNKDTCMKEIKDGKRKKFVVRYHGKKVTLHVKTSQTPEQNYDRFVTELRKQGLHFTLTPECAEEVAKITGKPLPGVVSKAVETVVKQVITKIDASDQKTLTQKENKITKDAEKALKAEIKKVEKESPSAPLGVPGAAGKDGKGNTNPEAEKTAKKEAEAGAAKQNEVAKEDTNPKTAPTQKDAAKAEKNSAEGAPKPDEQPEKKTELKVETAAEAPTAK